ncbi:MAG: MBL fold metallo-hydrolase [Lachnospiraceae bacterium]|nr:MBL fold metallo-hydrolase [Lachnospiraceae bacterium]
MELMFIRADHEVTGSCHYLRVGDTHILVDCGMEQGKDYYENVDIPVPESDIDYVLLTHAHVDHSGMLPLLYAKGFRGQIWMTKASADLCNIMLRDCAHIQMQEAEWKNRKAIRSGKGPVTPLYTMEDAQGTLRRIVPCSYDQRLKICDGVEVRFTDIGHLLGSSSIEIWAKEGEEERKLVFSGDIGNFDQPILKDPALTAEADYVIMESTYGDRYHSKERPDYVEELTKIIRETFARGGNVVVPSFAVGRTQEMLYFLRKIKSEKRIPEFPDFEVYVDSPMAVEATGIFQKNVYACFDEEAMELVERGINPIAFKGLQLSITSDESKAINFDGNPKVILSASGMCEAGRIRHHLKHNLWREDSTVLFVGYQAVGTLGRTLLEGASEVRLFGETIEVKARIARLAGISGHADKGGLLTWIQGFEKKPKRVFVVHGEGEVCDSFAECLREEYGYETYAPYSGTRFDLIGNRFLYEAVSVPIRKKPEAKRASDVFARLLAAGQRLLSVIRSNEGGSNKDLAKFTDQINSLCDKWQR